MEKGKGKEREKKKNNIKRKEIIVFSGFSLIELIIILTTISCILAAFAPLFSKKLSSSTYTAYSATGLSSMQLDCAEDFNTHCLMCEIRSDYKRCIICELECSSGSLNTDDCVCE